MCLLKNLEGQKFIKFACAATTNTVECCQSGGRGFRPSSLHHRRGGCHGQGEEGPRARPRQDRGQQHRRPRPQGEERRLWVRQLQPNRGELHHQ